MKKTTLYLVLLLSIGYITSCTRPVRHADPFYNVNSAFSMDPNRIPLIKPVEATYINFWDLETPFAFKYAPDVGNKIYYSYGMRELEKIDVQNGVIMAYSSYVNKNADAHSQKYQYHWLVIVLDQKIAKSFQTEDEFFQYIHTLNISDPDWITPSEANKQFTETGCLRWIPDCE